MPITGTCALCQTPASALLGSHIVPEFFYKRVYTNTHKFIAITLDEEERLPPEQKGFRENLLCAACETKFSYWERALSLFLNQVISGSYSTCSTTQMGAVTVVNGVDYANVKMAVLSIFWRMSIAKHKLFSLYQLGPYEEVFRRLLDQGSVPASTEFPVLLSKGMLDGVFRPGILFPVGRGRYMNHLIIQSVVLNGIVFDCFMTRTHTIPEEVVEFSLQSNGRVCIPSKSYEQLGMNLDEFSQRMKGQDVKKFYQKHSR